MGTTATTATPTCPHCAAGHAPAYQPHSREWVHRMYLVKGGSSQFSITLCADSASRPPGEVPERKA